MIGDSGADNPLPRQAIILAAGLGSRLRPLTDGRPKPLIEVHGTPILHNALYRLAEAGVERVTLVVGYRREEIVRACGNRFAGLAIDYVVSDIFDQTGSAYSLWLARHALDDGDVLYLEGDVFFDPGILERVLHLPGDAAALDIFDGTMPGSAALLTPDGMIGEIRTGQTMESLNGTPLYKTINICRFTAETARRHLAPALNEAIHAGETRAFVEQILARLVAEGRLRLRAALCGGIPWFEIDSVTDLRAAEAIFSHLQPRRITSTGLQGGAAC